MDPVRGVLMVIEVVFTNVSKSFGQSKFKKMSYKARSRTVRIWIKQGFKVSNKMMSTVVTLILFKVHVNPFTGQWFDTKLVCNLLSRLISVLFAHLSCLISPFQLHSWPLKLQDKPF